MAIRCLSQLRFHNTFFEVPDQPASCGRCRSVPVVSKPLPAAEGALGKRQQSKDYAAALAERVDLIGGTKNQLEPLPPDEPRKFFAPFKEQLLSRANAEELVTRALPWTIEDEDMDLEKFSIRDQLQDPVNPEAPRAEQFPLAWNLPSAGSFGHPEICSTACIFGAACRNRADCHKCHLPHQDQPMDKKSRHLWKELQEEDLLPMLIWYLTRRAEAKGFRREASEVILYLERRSRMLGEGNPYAVLKVKHLARLHRVFDSMRFIRLLYLLPEETVLELEPMVNRLRERLAACVQ